MMLKPENIVMVQYCNENIAFCCVCVCVESIKKTFMILKGGETEQTQTMPFCKAIVHLYLYEQQPILYMK